MQYAQTTIDGAPYVVASDDGRQWRRSESPQTLLGLLSSGRDRTLAATDAIVAHGEAVDVSTTPLGSSFGTPPTVRDFYAFEEHVKAGRRWRGLEMDPLWYERPVFYFSNPYAVGGSGPVAMTPATTEFDFEMEIAAVLWSGGRNVAPGDADSLIAGYCIMNDWSGRDVQREEMRLSMGPVKGKDTATSLGPILVTPDELVERRTARAFDLQMSVTVNGRLYAESNLSEIHWSFGELISYASRGTEVRAGDVIGSGTANGGCLLELRGRHGAEEYPWLKEGDRVEIAVDRLGVLHNTIVAADPIHPLR